MISGKPFFTGSVVGVGLGRFLFAASALAALCAPALAGPEGQQVIAGSAKFTKNGAVTTITAGNNSIINYRSFNIGAGETVRFIQPSATSRVLNRVGGGRTTIDGNLQANGIVYILNPAGVFFGGHAVVSTAGLVVGAGTMTNTDFQRGIDRFTGLTGGVSNFGTIQGSSVALIGQYVENHGVIYTERGTVTMASGDEVYMGPRNGGLYVKVKSDQIAPKGDRPGVDNSGTIVSGASLLTCGDMYSMAVRNTGTIQGRSIKIEGQGSGVVSVGGRLDASARGAGQKGGRVEVTGEKVGVFGATVNADGPAGGGTVLIGGQYQGGAGVRTADATYVSPGSTVSASATENGNGGKVVIWSEKSTRTYADLIARGAGDGRGGLVETSSKEFLDVGATPDVRAEGDDGGRWLIDPRNVDIVADGTGTNNGAINGTSPFTPTGDDATLEVDLIQAALLGAGVTVEVNTGATGTQDGDITLSTPLDFDGIGTGDTLLLDAANNIEINGAISDGTPGGDDLSLDLQAGGDITVTQGINLAGGTFTASGVNFTDAASNIVASSFTLNFTGNATLNNGSAVALNASTVGGDLTVTTSAGNITDNGTVTVGGNLSATTTGSNDDIDLGTLAVAGTVSANTSGATGNVTLTNATALDLAAMNVGGNLSATAATGNVTDSGTVTVGGTLSATTSGANADIDLGTLAVTGTVSANTNGATGDVTLTNANGLNLALMNVGGNLSATATAGNITDSGAVTVGGNLTATTSAPNADITLNDIAVAGAVGANTNGATGDATLVNTTDLNLAAMSVGGNLSATATTGAITDGGTVTVGGNATLTTTQADADIFANQLAVVGTIGLNTNGAAADATIVNASGINFASSSIGRNLAATATTGNITDAALVTVGSAGTFTTTAANADIDLGTAAIGGLVSLNTNGATGNATLVNSAGINFQTSNVGGNLVATASTGNISDTGTVTVTGSSTFGTSTSGASILLDNLAAAGVIIANTLGAAGHVTLSNTGAVNLGASTVGGNLTVTAGAGGTGAITDAGTVTVTGNSSFATSLADADIFLDALAATGTIALSTNGAAGDATVVNASGINFAASSIGRNLSATATTGNITDGAAVTVGTNGTFTTSASGADITLDATAVGGSIAANTTGAGGDVSITHATAVDLAGSTIGGGLTVVAATGNITDSGTVTVGGNADFTTSQANDDIVVNQLAVAGTVGVHTNGATADALVTNTTALNLAASQVGRTLTATATTGNLTDSGTVALGTSGSFTTGASGADITLDTTSAPTLSANTTGAGGDVSITGAAGVNLGASNIGGALTVIATTGNITDAATLTVGGNADFTTSQANDDITVDQLAVTGTVGVHTTGATGNATVINATVLNMAASGVGGNLLATATTGNLTDAGTLTVTGTAGFTTSQAGADITVNQLAVGGAISANTVGANGDVTIVDAATLNLGASTVNGALTATATTGNLVDSGAVSVSGNGSFTTLGTNADIALAQTTVGGTIALNTTGATGLATLIHNGTVNLAASSVGGDLSIIASNGDITDAGLVTVGGAGNFTTTLADADINLGTLAVSGTISLSTTGTGGDATIVNATGVDLGTSTIGNDLSVTATTGNLTDSGIADVDGDAVFTTLSPTGQITLDQLDVAGTVTFNSGGDVTIHNTTGVDLQAMTVGGDLDVTADTGDITDSGTISVVGTSTLTATTGNIDVDQFSGAGDFFLTAGGNATLVNAIATILGTSTVAGDLAVTSTLGNLTDSGLVTFVNGTFTTSQAAADINLGTLAGSGTVAFNTSGAGANATAVNSTAVDLDTSSVGGVLSVTATTGNVTDSGAVTAGQGASFTTSQSNADIDLDLLAVTGGISLATSGATGNATIVNSGATTLGTSNVGGALDATSGAGMTDSGIVTVAGTADFTAASGQDITLDQLAVTGQITPNVSGAGADVTLVNATGVNIGAWNVPGNLSVNATTGNLADSGTATVGGTGSFTTSAANATITLDLLSVAGLIDVHTNGANGDATLVNATDIAFGASTVGGDLFATATTSGISDGGAVSVAGDAAFETLAAGTISLDQTTVGGTIHLDTASGDATLIHNGDVDLGASSVAGNLSITATSGSISDSGIAVATGDGNFTTAVTNETIALNQLDVGGAISLSTAGAAGDATIVNAGAIDLNTSDVGGDLALTATTGGITDSGEATVGGTTTLTAGATEDITLDGLGIGSDFGGAVSVTNGQNVLLMDQNDLALGDVTTTGSLAATAADSLDSSAGDLSVGTSAALIATAGDITLGNVTTGTTLVATAAGDLDSSAGELDAGSSAALTATAGDMTLGNVTTGTTLVATAAGDLDAGAGDLDAGSSAALTATAGDMTLGNLTTGTTLAAIAGGSITQTGSTTIAVTGATTLAAGAGAGEVITLNQATNNFHGVTVTAGRDVTLRDADALAIGASTISGNLVLTSVGATTQSGALTVAGTTTLNAGTSAITLNNTSNDFTGAVSVSNGGAVNLRDTNALVLGNIGTGTVASLIAQAGGNLSQAAGTGIDATGGATLTAGGALTLRDLSSGTLGATAATSITQAAGTAITVAGATTLTGGTALGNVITLDQANNDFTGAVTIAAGGDVTVRDTNNLTVGGTATRDLTASADNTLALTASTVGGDLTLDAGTGSVSVAATQVGGNADIEAGTSFTNTGLFDVDGNLGVAAGTTIGQSASLNVGGTTSLTAGGNITLSNAGNDFQDTVNADGANVTLLDTNALDLGTVVATGDASLTAGGAVTLDTITAGDAVTIAAGGSILEAGAGDGAGGVDITGESANLTAVGGIGATSGAGAIETSLDSLTAANSGSGAINIAETDGINLVSVGNTGGAVLVTAGSNGSIQATSVSSSSAATLTAAGGMTIGSVTAAGGVVTLNASNGSIVEIGGGDAGNDIVADSLVLNATGTAGGGAGGALETAVSTLDAEAVNGITISNAGDLAATLVSNAGAVTISSTGTLSTNGAAWAGDGFTIRADDLEITDDINSSDGVTIGRVTSGSIGLGTGAGDLQISGAELTRISAATDLTVGGTGVTAINVGDVALGDSQGIAGTTNLNATGAGAAINFTGDAAFNRLSSISAGVTTLADDSSVTVALGGLTLSAGGGIVTQGDANLAANGLLTLSSALSGGGAGTTLSLTGSDVALNAALNVGGGDVAVGRSSAGQISVGAASGGMRIDGDELSRITAHDLTIGGANVSGITASGVLSAQSDGIGLVALNAGAAGGVVTFSGDPSTFAGVSASGTSINVATSQLTGSTRGVTLSAPTTLSTDVIIAGSAITLSTVNSSGGARSLTLNSAGVTSLGDVGVTSALSSLQTNAGGSTNLSGDVRTTTNVQFNDAVTLSDDVAVRNDGVSGVVFEGSVTGPHNLDVNAEAGDAVFNGNVDLHGAAGQAGGNLTVTKASGDAIAGDALFAQGVNLSGGSGADGGNLLVESEGDVFIDGAIITSGGSGGGNGGDITLAAGSGTTLESAPGGVVLNVPDHIIRLGNNVTAEGGSGGSGGLITFGQGRTEIPSDATIVFQQGEETDVTFEIKGGQINIGPNEKLVSVGGLTLDAAGDATFGDLAALGPITVIAESIHFRTRAGAGIRFAPVDEELSFGEDEGADIVTGSTYTFKRHDNSVYTTLQRTDSGFTFTAAAVDLNSSTVLSDVLNQKLSAADAELADFVGEIDGRTVFFDINSQGSGNQNVASSLAGILPTESRPEVSQSNALTAGQKDAIRQLGITPRGLTPDEVIQFLAGMSLYDDYPTVVGDETGVSDYMVAVNRLPSDRVQRLLEAYDALFITTVVDPDTGQSQKTNRTAEIEASLSQAVRRYMETRPAGTRGVDPAAFRAYLEAAPEEGEAREWVHRLEGFLKQLKQLGLGPKEERIAIDELLGQVVPTGIETVPEFEMVINPPAAPAPDATTP